MVKDAHGLILRLPASPRRAARRRFLTEQGGAE